MEGAYTLAKGDNAEATIYMLVHIRYVWNCLINEGELRSYVSVPNYIQD